MKGSSSIAQRRHRRIASIVAGVPSRTDVEAMLAR
jgi:hypothetical protein